MTWSEIYKKEIIRKGGLLPFILNKEKRSAGALIKRLIKNFKFKSKILEIGTGTGAIGALLIKHGFNVTGIDNDKEMIEIAKISFAVFGNPDKVLNIDAKDTINIFGKNSFDCVISHGMLEHYSDSMIISHLNDQLELAPVVIFVVPMKAMSTDYKSRGLGDERYLTTTDWKKLLKNNFHLTKNFGFGLKETNNRLLSEKIIGTDFGAKIFAPLCAFNEFWITKNQ
jgi:SAM-dependent methyltransferase